MTAKTYSLFPAAKLYAAVLLLLLAAGCGGPDPEKFLLAPDVPALPYTPPAQRQYSEKDIPLADDLPRVRLKTTQGEVLVELFEDEAPNTVANFLTRVEDGYYTDLDFHSVTPNLVVTGDGDPVKRCIPFEKNDRMHLNVRGAVGMVPQPGRHGAATEFYIVKSKDGKPEFDRARVVFGRVLVGMKVVDKLKPMKDKLLSAKVVRKRKHPYKVESLPVRADKRTRTIDLSRLQKQLRKKQKGAVVEEAPIPTPTDKARKTEPDMKNSEGGAGAATKKAATEKRVSGK